jgi:hypothetical protein
MLPWAGHIARIGKNVVHIYLWWEKVLETRQRQWGEEIKLKRILVEQV